MLLNLVKDKIDLTQSVSYTTFGDLLPALDAVADAAFLLGLFFGSLFTVAALMIYGSYLERRRPS